MKDPYLHPKVDVLQTLSADRQHGLSQAEAEKRLAQNGPNQLEKAKAIPAWQQLLHSLKEPLMIILFIAVGLGALSAWYDFAVTKDHAHAMASVYEAIAILLLIMVNAGLSFWQARAAQKSMAALQSMAAHHALVLRDDDWQEIPADQLVAGDILKVHTGDFIEADVRWLHVAELSTNESHLTGESEPVAKQTHSLIEETGLGDRTNMGYSGATVTHGNGIGVVVATGMQTELGQIAQLLAAEKPGKTPLAKSVERLSKRLMLVALFVVILTLGLELYKAVITTGWSFAAIAEALSTAIALAVAAIPDAMPAVLAIVLTIGANQLARHQGLIKSLNAVETLGATSFIASDKTGTLTQNQMTVTDFWVNGQYYHVEGNGLEASGEIFPDGEYHDFIQAAVLNNEAEVRVDADDELQAYGNPTDVALVVLGQKAGILRGDQSVDILRVLPFDSTRKMMSVVIKQNDQYHVLTKGAPDVIQQRLAQPSDELPDVVLHFASQALRTIAVSQREITEDLARHGSVQELEQQLDLLGIAGIIDPPRPEVKKSVATLHQAGVAVVMITGDHAATARAIALKLGIVSDPKASVIEGATLDGMDDQALFDLVPSIRIYARVTPAHKQRIIKALQQHDQIVAMTGDGINDAPALKAADIGIAMGINGTEVTKDAADLILLDDRFTTIEHSVEAGRTIFANIKNFMRHELTTNVAEVLALLLGVALMTQQVGHVPATTPVLSALMVLWVNMVSDALPSFALGYDVPEADLMKQPPRNVHQSILHGMLGRIALRGIVMGGVVYLAFLWAAQVGMKPAEAQTVAFLTLVFGQLWHVFDARSTRTLFHRNPFENGKLLIAVAFAAVASLLVTVMPFFNMVMGTAPLSNGLYLAVVVLPAIPTLLISGIKALWLRRS